MHLQVIYGKRYLLIALLPQFALVDGPRREIFGHLVARRTESALGRRIEVRTGEVYPLPWCWITFRVLSFPSPEFLLIILIIWWLTRAYIPGRRSTRPHSAHIWEDKIHTSTAAYLLDPTHLGGGHLGGLGMYLATGVTQAVLET